MYSITKQKTLDEIKKNLEGMEKVYIVGCGTCATMCHTGGKAEVLEMKQALGKMGKIVTGWMVIPTACSSLTKEALAEESGTVEEADAILVMSCAFGVQTVSQYSERLAVPALNTLFVGIEDSSGDIAEVCMQCGDCVIGLTAGICPITRCAKGLLNGPCGGSVNGKCEISREMLCAWQLIYDRLAKLGLLDKLAEIQPPRDWDSSHSGGPRRLLREDLKLSGK